jgi:drug/metabolite transporter (DMT)-like permease
MSTIAIEVIAILLITVIVLIITILWVKKNKINEPNMEIDYRAFFILGICLLPLGIFLTFVFRNPGLIGFMGLGGFYIVYSLANKDKWKRKNKII